MSYGFFVGNFFLAWSGLLIEMSTRMLLNQFSSQPFMVGFYFGNNRRARLLALGVLIDLAGTRCQLQVRDNVAAMAT